MDAINMEMDFGLWQQGMPDAHTPSECIDKAEAWVIDSVCRWRRYPTDD
jgi:hypothetical protein